LTASAPPPTTVADALLVEMTRVRDAVMPHYLALPHDGGAYALDRMRAELDAAARALAYQDAIGCIRALNALRSFTT
jgi:hypothetical protein